MAKTIAPLFIRRISPAVRSLPVDTPMNTSAPSRASPTLVKNFSFPVTQAISFFGPFVFRKQLQQRDPLLSKTTIFRAPYFDNSFVTAVPAAPAPEITIRTFLMFFFTTLSALTSPARTAMAVPCWSSWKTGMSSSFTNLFSISKHLGAEISSRFIPPKPGAIFFTVSMIFSVSCVARIIGTASTFANSLNKTDFPSITGRAASGPRFPKPKMALPSETIATLFFFQVSSKTFFLFFAISRESSATPGV